MAKMNRTILSILVSLHKNTRKKIIVMAGLKVQWLT